MLNFIVLGIIPGTSVQISFWGFLLVSLLLSLPFMVWALVYVHSSSKRLEKSVADKQMSIEMIAL